MKIFKRIKNSMELKSVSVDNPDIDGLVAWLLEEFDLEDHLAETISEMIDGGGHFELTLDSPFVANWRLKPNTKLGEKGVRIADYTFPLRQQDREAELNAKAATFYGFD